jgi:hypothetical protein
VTQAQHEDPFGEVRTQAAQALAVAATVGEAAARWYAAGLQKKAGNAETDNRIEAAERAADRLANRTEETQDQQLIDKGLTDWLKGASMKETVRLWRTATIYAADGNARAAQAANLAQERLRLVNRPLMDAYDRHRASGRGPAEAMKAAAYDVWEAEARARAHPPKSDARPHGTREPDHLTAGANGKALPTGGTALDDIDAAVRAEVGLLAAHISPEAPDNLQRTWRDHGLIPAADAAGLLAQVAREAASAGQMPTVAAASLINTNRSQADTEQRMAELEDSTPDDHATDEVNEHDQGHDRANIHTEHADADRDAAATQQQLMGQAFPPLTSIGRVPAHVATKQTATAVTTQRKPRTR